MKESQLNDLTANVALIVGFVTPGLKGAALLTFAAILFFYALRQKAKGL